MISLRVDFNSMVDDDMVVARWPEADVPLPGTEVLAIDDDGNRCLATVVGRSNSQRGHFVELTLVMSTWVDGVTDDVEHPPVRGVAFNFHIPWNAGNLAAARALINEPWTNVPHPGQAIQYDEAEAIPA